MIEKSGSLFASCETLAEALRAMQHVLDRAGIDDSEADARRLVCAAFRVSRIDLVLRAHQPATPASIGRLEEYASRRLKREPVTRILGSRGFWSLDLDVRPNVLDPRADTEVLVEAGLEALGARVGEPLRILDVGTGSGALIAALLSELPRAEGWAIDVSPDAVAAARANLARLGLGDRSTVLQQSWTEPLPGTFDLVVSNPPYIESEAIALLDPEVADYDPHLALDGGPDGIDAYRSIAAVFKSWLNGSGVLVLEIGSTQAEPVGRIFRETGARLLDLRQDYAGRDRAMVFSAGVL